MQLVSPRQHPGRAFSIISAQLTFTAHLLQEPGALCFAQGVSSGVTVLSDEAAQPAKPCSHHAEPAIPPR